MQGPRIVQRSWKNSIPGVIIVMVLVFLCTLYALYTHDGYYYFGLLYGLAIYYGYWFTSHSILNRHNRKGLKASDSEDFIKAIEWFKMSYDFMSRHTWIDKYRSIILLDASAISIREIDLLNIAFCYGQMGSKERTREYYRRTLEEFPKSKVATNGLRLLGN